MGACRVWRRSEQRRQLRSLASSAAGSGAADGRRVVHLAPALAEGLPPAGRWLRRLLYPPIAAITEAAGSGGGGERENLLPGHARAAACRVTRPRAALLCQGQRVVERLLSLQRLLSSSRLLSLHG